MKKISFFFTPILFFCCSIGLGYCNSPHKTQDNPAVSVIVGAERFDKYLSLLEQKNIGLVVNQTSLVGRNYEVHIVDTLLKLKVVLKKIYSPEHGFRGKADAGEEVQSSLDKLTGLPIVSLYGNHKKPTKEDLEGVDIMIFDIQDVGARFYTYISTMHYVMEACAENNIPLIVLDRPNPNGFYIDGPVLKPEFKSFVGMHPIPIVHGMTVGEFAQMINAEGWLEGGVKCSLTVIPCLNYDHKAFYKLPVKPSPNLPNMTAIYLYPSLCLFEGTTISVGRGTESPFQVLGNPELQSMGFSFTPQSMDGAKEPKYLGDTCYGINLSAMRKEDFARKKSLNLTWLIEFYKKFPEKEKFFNSFFEKLAGTGELRKQIEQGMTEEEIRKSWFGDLENFFLMRKKYLLYPDF